MNTFVSQSSDFSHVGFPLNWLVPRIVLKYLSFVYNFTKNVSYKFDVICPIYAKSDLSKVIVRLSLKFLEWRRQQQNATITPRNNARCGECGMNLTWTWCGNGGMDNLYGWPRRTRTPLTSNLRNKLINRKLNCRVRWRIWSGLVWSGRLIHHGRGGNRSLDKWVWWFEHEGYNSIFSHFISILQSPCEIFTLFIALYHYRLGYGHIACMPARRYTHIHVIYGVYLGGYTELSVRFRPCTFVFGVIYLSYYYLANFRPYVSHVSWLRPAPVTSSSDSSPCSHRQYYARTRLASGDLPVLDLGGGRTTSIHVGDLNLGI